MRRVLGVLAFGLAGVALAACGGGNEGDGSAGAAPKRDGAAATIKTFQFRPGDLHVHAGTRVTWTNRDDIEHTVTAEPAAAQAGESFDGSLDGAGSTFAHRFAEPGTYAYRCARHPGMHGRVVVGR